MDTQLRSQAELINDHLEIIEDELNDFLDFTSIDKVLDSNHQVPIDYIQNIFREFRYLAVYCGEGKRAITKLIQTDQLEQNYVDRVYKGIYYKCVIEYFSPKDEIWTEDSRASYRNKCSIDFRDDPGEIIEQTMKKVEPSFHELREQLDYLDL
ncbi:DUF3907 family protein [Aquisalibacillus elongatus]|uniref:Uncharacterized protein DUF3907 n=1 Tax=Aquisalibacillus elongatus TaxID=485577 RepID=A0A3N5C0Y4_9BACI|nr:DUF3907 family protein [Aquisalibacillus elongatus]RPF55728.1 uncharacterized protein DUF3907 [Aquisalibacillus elongatus]